MTAPDSSRHLEEEALECVGQAAKEPALVVDRATRLRAVCRRDGEWSADSIAARALGIALKQLDDLAGSSGSFRAAIRSGKRAGSERLVAQARASLAGTLMLQGHTGRALAEVTAAVSGLRGVEAAQVEVDRAAVLQLSGRFPEAMAGLQTAVPVLRRAGKHDLVSRALSNRSLLHIAARSFHAAEDDLRTSLALCAEHGLSMWAAYAEQNMGWLASSIGDVASALEHYDAAERLYRELGADVGSLYEAKARLFLMLRLVDEARSAADEAVRVHRGQRRKLEIVDAELLLSTVALVQGDSVTALSAATRAVNGFRRLGQHTGLALAKYARLQAKYQVAAESVSHAQARRCADELAECGWLVPSLDARVMAGRLALARGQRKQAQRDLADAARARSTGPAEVRVRAWLAQALLHRAEGRRREARRAVSNGLRVLELYQNTLGASELRAHVSIHRGSIARLGLQMAMEDGRARSVLSFVERGRASALLRRPGRPPPDAELSAALADLRTTVTEIETNRLAGRPTGHLVQRQVRLEREVADRCRRFPAATGTLGVQGRTVPELVDALGQQSLIEFVELAGRLYAISVADGVARMHDLGEVEAVTHALAHVKFALRRLARPTSTRGGQSAASSAIATMCASLDRQLFAPMRRRLADRPLVLVPSDCLQAMPWSVLPTCESRPISVVPSARLWLNAIETAASDGGATVIVAGPGLPGAQAEAQAVAGLYPNAVTFARDDAEVDRVRSAIEGAELVHVAAHGRLRSDNPSFSSLVLTDGPLTVYELERLHRAPRHVVLAACEAATPSIVAVDEVLGLASVLLGQGTRSLIAPVVKVLDTAVVDLMVNYHLELLGGSTPAEALAKAQAKAAAGDAVDWACAAGFICMGAGHVV